MKKGKHAKVKQKSIMQIFCIIILLTSIISLVLYFNRSEKEQQSSQDILNNIEIDVSQVTEEKSERILQLEELQKENDEIIAWLEIEGTSINYPVCQTTNNDYYLSHNYKKEKSTYGSLFLDKDFDLTNGSSNYLIYGHRSTKGLMFEDLMKYAKEDFYKDHPTIKFTTLQEDATYEIIAVFYSRVYYKNEKNVFRYYYFVNAENEEQYNNFVNNAKKVSIYDTGVTATYGEQLLTLSTCEYSQEDGRFAIVAKKK
ncbi:MAG: class B sortase [Clostridia bacterium]|nr:class B sortase [Clostridia bacterium]